MSRRGAHPGGVEPVAFAAVAVTIVTWASAFAAVRVGLKAFSPVELATARYGSAAIVAALYLAVVRPPLPAPRDLLRLAVIGPLFIAAYSVLFNYGEVTVHAGPAAFILQVNPVIVALIAMPLLGERFGFYGWAGTFLSFLGVGLIALGSGDHLSLDIGALFILGAAVCTSVSTILQKPLLGRMPASTATMWILMLGAVPLIPAVPQTVAALAEAPVAVLVPVAYLAFVPTLIGYWTWAEALKRFPAGRASNFLYCIAPTAALIGYFWLGEVPTPIGIVGGAMALGGVLVVNLFGRRKAAAG